MRSLGPSSYQPAPQAIDAEVPKLKYPHAAWRERFEQTMAILVVWADMHGVPIPAVEDGEDDSEPVHQVFSRRFLSVTAEGRPYYEGQQPSIFELAEAELVCISRQLHNDALPIGMRTHALAGLMQQLTMCGPGIFRSIQAAW
jgi:hypothetical protein